MKKRAARFCNPGIIAASALLLLAGVCLGEQTAVFTVAAVQAVSKLGNVSWNRAHLETMVRRAASAGANVVVLPETAITGYMSHDIKTTWQVGLRRITHGLTGLDPRDAAETIPGPSTRHFARLAAELNIYLTVPLLEFDPRSGNYYNSVVLISPDTTYCGYYRKLNPWPFAERGWAAEGDLGHSIIDTPFGRMALLICFDINFEPPRLKQLGVDHLLYPIAWVDAPQSDWFEKRLPAIAAKNDINIVGANWTVPENFQPDWHGWGKTRIIDRRGKILAKAADDRAEEIVYADLPIPDHVLNLPPATDTPKETDAPAKSAIPKR